MIWRTAYMDQVREALRRNPIAMLVGPRQCGKTTLARQLLAGDSSTFFDMEDPAVRSALTEPMSALRDLRGTVVIDEAQREPALFPVLRVLADRPAISTRFLLLGSATPELSRQAAESLAG
ncbi:MAG TPA: AAA family ATPase, partial [Flavobacteriales bacterium]|nr:AAA family ATPase [Flavobacteriales bacterium]